MADENLKDFTIEGPDGHSYTVTAAADATDEELINFVQQNLTSQPAEKASPQVTVGQGTGSVAPAPVEQKEPTVVVQGAPGTKDHFRLDPQAQAEVDQAMADPKMSWEDVNALVNKHLTAGGQAPLGLGGSPEDLAKYREALTKGAAPVSVGYQDFTDTLPEASPSISKLDKPTNTDNPIIQTSEALGRGLESVIRSYQEGVQYGFPGLAARTYQDWVDAGKEELRKRYPGATDEQLEVLSDAAIAHTQKSLRAANAKATKNDPVIPYLAGQLLSSVGLEDLVPGGEVAGLAKRTVRAVTQNVGADVGYQALDVNQGVQDEYNPEQTLGAATLGGAFHLGVEGLHALASTKKSVPSDTTSVSTVTTKADAAATFNKRVDSYIKDSGKNPTKAVRTRAAAQATTDHINDITSGWKNAPEFEVHENFSKLNGVEKDAIGATTPDGKVLVNLDAVIKNAKRAKVAPSDVISAVTYHEALGHHGLSQKFGDELEDTLTRFYDNGTSTFRDKVDKWLEENPTAYEGQSNRLALGIEEILAEMSEKGQLPVTLKDRVSNLIKDFARRMGLDLKFSEREIKTILGMAHNATINGRPNDVRGNGFKYMNVGEKANLPVDRQADRIRAQIKDSQGISPDEIYSKFGWWKDQDGKWRTRISDKDSVIYADLDTLPERGSVDLEDILHHPQLFDAYPWLRNLPISRETNPRNLGSYSPSKKEISLNPETLRGSGEDIDAVLLHEIQHAIQHKEGFAGGGNVDVALQDTLKQHEILPAAKELLKEKHVELENIESTIESMTRAIDGKLASEDLKNQFRNRRNELRTKQHYLEDDIDYLSESIRHEDMADLRERVLSSTLMKREAYEWLMGEIEARETEALQFHSEEDLKNVPRGVGSVEGKNPDYIRIMDRQKTSAKEEPRVQDERRKRQEQEFQGSRGAKTPAEETIKRAENVYKSDSEEIIDRAIAQVNDVLDNHPLSGLMRGRAVEALHRLNELRVQKFIEGGDAKYMRQYTPDEEAAIESAQEINQGALDNYQPQYRSWAEGKRAARERGLTAKQIRKAKSIGELDKRLFQYDLAAQKTDEKLAQLHHKMDTGEFSAADKARYLETVFSYNEMTARIFEDQAEIGRALNAMKALSYTKNKLARLNEILEESKGTGLAGFANEDNFRNFVDQIKYLMETDNLDGAHAALRDVTKPYWWEYVLSFRHSMMLSGLGTHAKNAKDNALMVARELEESILATPGFVVRKGLRAAGANVKDGVSPQEVAGRLYGILRAALDSATWSNTWDSFLRGHPNRILNPKIEQADARIPVVSKVSDALYAADTFFRAFHNNANLYSLGVRRAMEEGLQGLAAFEEGSNYAANPSERMLKESKAATDTALLVDTPSWLAAKLEVTKAIRPHMKPTEQLGAFVSNLLFPFFRVTDRLLFQQLRRSPLAFLDKNTRADLEAGGARMDIAIARMVYGSALIYYYWLQAGDGNVVGEGPSDYDKKKALEAGGYKSNSVLKDGKYVDATALNLSFSPWDLQNTVAANVATIRQAYDSGKADKKSTAEALGMASLSLGTLLSSNSFAENISLYTEPFRQTDQLDKDTAIANLGGSLASQWVPAALRQYNQVYGDPVQRDTTGDKSISDRIAGRVKAGIPGLSETLPAKYDVYGDQMQQGRTLSSLNNYQEVKTDAVSKELQRLEKTTPKAVVTGAPSSFELTGVKEGVFNPDFVRSTDNDTVKLTAAGKQEWQRVQGWYLRQGMSKLIQSPAWKKATDKQKIAIVKQLKSEASTATKEHMISQLGLQAREDYEEQ